MQAKLIADSGATKCEWCLIYSEKKLKIVTRGISPYFLTASEIVTLLKQDLLPKMKNKPVNQVYFYGTGLGNIANRKLVKNVLMQFFPSALMQCNTDMLAAARAVCGNNKGIACILGTGSNSCYYNGQGISKNRPSLGYILGDEGSGAYMGKIVLRNFLYNTIDNKLNESFISTFHTNAAEILVNVYSKPQPNKYIAGFTHFLAKNRGHQLVETILEDSLNDFFITHLIKYKESYQYPVSFVGSVAFAFKDVLKKLCNKHNMQLGTVMKQPMDGLIEFHS